jgi:ATP-dependent Clp protease ATP-binding subunit ClpA
MMAELSQNRQMPAERSEARLTIPNGVLVGGRVRLDPLFFRKACLVSVRSEEDGRELDPGDAGIPRPWRPRLADIRLLLKKRRRWLGWPLAPMDQRGTFVLRAVDDPAPEIQTKSGVQVVDAGSDAGFRVIGMLNHSIPQAAERLSEPGRLSQGDWLKAAELFAALTAGEAKWAKDLPSAINLTALDPAGPKFPVVNSERFVRAGAAIWKGLLRSECTAVQRKGDAGTGKSRLVRSLAEDMLNMRVPSRLQAHLMVSLNIELFMASFFSFEESEKNHLRDEMAGRRIIWVIDEASRLVERGETASLDSLLLFIDAGAKVILLSDQAHLLEKREAFMRRLSPVYLPPADRSEVHAVVAARAQSLEKATGLAVRPEAITAASDLSYGSVFAQPHAALTLIGNTVTSCELAGQAEVTAEHVEHELQVMFSQGSLVPRMPVTVSEWLERLRDQGFRGHDSVSKAFGQSLLRALRRRHRPDRPPGPVWSGIIAGESASGKTLLANLTGRLITGSERKVKQIDCNFFQTDHAVQSLLGSPMSYIGHGEGGILQNFLKKNPDGVLIFKKPEAGHRNVLKILEGILAGEFTAGDGQPISTHGLVVIIATGAGTRFGSAPIGLIRAGDQTGTRLHADLGAVFPSRVLTQIGIHNVFYLGVLEPAALRDILGLQIRRYAREEGIALHVEEAVLEEVLGKLDAAAEGARGPLVAFRKRIEPLLDEQLEEAQGARRLRVFLGGQRKILCCPDDSPPDAPAECSKGEIHGD